MWRSGVPVADGHVIVLDAGTSRLRCVVFDQQYRIVACRSSEWTEIYRPHESPYSRDFDAGLLWDVVSKLIMESVSQSCVSPRDLTAITVTSQRQGIVFLDLNGCELYAGPNVDLRAVFEGGAIDEDMREVVYKTTGHLPSFMFAPAKLRWFQIQHPDVYSRITSVLTLADWLVWKLTGVLISEPSLAAEAGLLDISLRQWCTDLLAKIGIDHTPHIPLTNSGNIAGEICVDAAHDSGLVAGIPVVVAGADTQCGLLGMGVDRERQAGIVAGWSLPVQAITNKPIFSPKMNTWSGCYLTPDKWVLESNGGDAGNSYQWIADMFWRDSEQAFSEMDIGASRVSPGSDGTLAFLGSSRMNVNRVGMGQGGFMFPVPLTYTGVGREHMVRAAIEGISYAVKANVLQIEELTGETIEFIAVGGGMIRTESFVRVLADVLGRSIKISAIPAVSAYGASLCAATAIGDFASLDEAASVAVSRLHDVDPDRVAAADYVDRYEQWLEVLRKLEKIGA